MIYLCNFILLYNFLKYSELYYGNDIVMKIVLLKITNLITSFNIVLIYSSILIFYYYLIISFNNIFYYWIFINDNIFHFKKFSRIMFD